MAPPTVALVGIGHAHALLLTRLAARPLPTRVVVVSPSPITPYSGAVPGYIEGVLTEADVNVNVAALAAAAGADFVVSAAVAVDPVAAAVTLAGADAIPYDVLSINVGGAAPPVPGGGGGGDDGTIINIRPLAGAAARLAPLLTRVDAAAAGGAATSVLVVGGGAAGVEVAACLAARGRGRARVTLAAGDRLLPGVAPAARALIARELASAGVTVDESGPVVAVARGGGRTARGRVLPCDAAVLCLPAAAPAWLKDTGLTLDSAGFLVTDAGHACSLAAGGARPPRPVFAAGDCATCAAAPTPKAGVYAVRSVPVLEAAVRAAVSGAEFEPPPPRARPALALVSLGRGRAAAIRPGWPPVAGGWVWRWKRWLDGRHVQRLRVEK